MSTNGGSPQQTSGYSIAVDGAVDVPDRTVIIDDEELGSDSFTVTAIGRVDVDETFTVDVAAPSETWQLELFDNKLNSVGSKPPQEGDLTATFDANALGLDAGSYVLAAMHDGAAQAVFPIVVRGWAVDITAGPSSITSQEDLTVEATISDLTGKTVEDVQLAVMSGDSTTGGSVDMDEENPNIYEATLSNLEHGEYEYSAVVRGTETVDVGVEAITVQENPTETSGDSSTDQISVIDGANEAIGFADPVKLTVELADADKLAQKWTDDRGNALQYSTVDLDNEFVYVGGLDDSVEALRRNSGSQKWEVPRSGSLSDSSPLLADGTIYIGGGGGVMYALDATDGSQVWTADVGSAVTSSPVVVGGDVYFGSNDGRVHSVPVGSSGSVTPTSMDLGVPIYSDLAADPNTGHVFITTADRLVVAIDGIGTIAWNGLTTVDMGASSPRYHDGRVYIAGGFVLAIDPATGGEIWRQGDYGETAGSTPTVADGVVYVGSAEGNLSAYTDANDGALLWRSSTGGAIASTPAIVDDRVIVGSMDGSVYVFDRQDGTEVWSEDLGAPIRSSPVVSNDEVYIGTEDDTVYVLENVP